MRRVFTTAEAIARGVTPAELRWGERTGRWRRIERGVYVEGSERPILFESAIGAVKATGGVATGHLAGVLHGLDSVAFDGSALARRAPYLTLPPGRGCRRAGVRERRLPDERIIRIDGLRCTDGLQTLVDLAAWLGDLAWEQALESGLRRRLTSVGAMVAMFPELGRARTPGARRIRRVLALRPIGSAPTDSLLETLMVQLARNVFGLGEPVRQLELFSPDGALVARVDLAWPELGLFVELDGEHHLNQPRYDSRRETAIVALTGWLCGRFTWTEVTRLRVTTSRRLADLARQARLRPPSCQSVSQSGRARCGLRG